MTEPLLTWVVVAHRETHDLLRLLTDLIALGVGPTILVDNGLAPVIAASARRAGAQHLTSATNVGCGAGRNLGAGAAMTELVGFVDADAGRPDLDADAVTDLFMRPEVVAARGRIPVSRTPRWHRLLAHHYDLGSSARPSTINLEGLSIWRRAALLGVGGFTPGRVGGEGREALSRIRRQRPTAESCYLPSLTCEHTYAESLPEGLRKRARQGVRRAGSR